MKQNLLKVKNMKNTFLLIVAFFFFNVTNVFAQSCLTDNKAVNNPVFASFPYDGITYVSNINDGSMSTQWIVTQGGDQWAYIDLTENLIICKVILRWETWKSHNNFKIQVTNTPADATSWQDVAAVNRVPENGTNEQYHSEELNSNTLSKRYVRILMLGVSAWNVRLNEIEINNKVGGSNLLPTVNITAPANNSVLTAGGSININATASDPDGSITKVEFYQGSTKLGEDLTEPYSYTWSNVIAGSYSLQAKAFDNLGASDVSAVIDITVANASSGWTLTGNMTTSPTSHFIGTIDTQRVVFRTNNTEKMTILANGLVGIGTMKSPVTDPTAKLSVEGTIYTRKLQVTQVGWADYVFDKNYKLLSLLEVEKFIKKNKHLPHVPSAKEVEKKGISVGDNQAVLLRKIEELTLYMIELNKKVEEQKKEIEQLKKQKN